MAEAVRAGRDAFGHRPAVTVLRADGLRHEQGVASLERWAAKTANLLAYDHLVEPGTRIAVVGPLGWPPAALCLGAWIVGAVVVEDPSAADLVFAYDRDGRWGGGGDDSSGGGDRGRGDPPRLHDADRDPVPGDLTERGQADGGVGAWESAGGVDGWWGDAFDGAPADDREPAVTLEAQTMPDDPPPPRAAPDAPAYIEADGRSWTQAALLDRARESPDGAVGVDAVRWDLDALVAVTLRPFVTGRATVVLAGAGRDAATAERVTTWLDARG